MTTTAGLLADHGEVLDALARLMESEWPDWYRTGGASARSDLEDRLSGDRLPLGIVAFVDGHVAGTCALTVGSGGLETDRTPWLGGLLVDPQFRRRGVGVTLLKWARAEARRLGFERLFALTAEAGNLFRDEGWTLLETVALQGVAHEIYETDTR